MRAVVLLLALFPAAGWAQDSWRAYTESRLESSLSSLRLEKPRSTTERGNLDLWQPGPSFGAQVELAKNWALRIDLDRYRPKYPGAIGRENIDTVTLYLSFASL